MAYCTVEVLLFPNMTQIPQIHHIKSKVTTSTLCSSSSSTQPQTDTTTTITTKQFTYSRASPSIRYPHLNLNNNNSNNINNNINLPNPNFIVIKQHTDSNPEHSQVNDNSDANKDETRDSNVIKLDKVDEETGILNTSRGETLGVPSKTRAKKMTKLALKRAKDWRQRVEFLTDKILGLEPGEFVADVLDKKPVQMTPTDYCYVVKSVGNASWNRALEVYEWLNLKRWYSPNPRMLATILSVLGKANQEVLAVEVFDRGYHAVGNTVQVYNAMMGVYARNGRFSRVQEMLNLMREKGCEPDLVSFNTLINARLRSGPLVPNLVIDLLGEVRRSGLRPDIITYNTLMSACARESNLGEAVRVYDDMVESRCRPDLWTYNAMISVYGRCGMSSEAEELFNELGSKGFSPDAVTYNSLLFAFAREGNDEKAKEIFEEMVRMGFEKDEMSYNTIIDMYGKNGRCEMALQVYKDMKKSGRRPDVITYTVLIDSLGKENMMSEASELMSEMLDSGVKPTLKTYTALICGYAKAGKRVEADETFNCMIKSGIKSDYQAYSVMLDIHLRSSEIKKATSLYHEMVCSGFAPDRSLHEALFRELRRANKEEDINKVITNMERISEFDTQVISSILVKGECYDHAAKLLRKAIVKGCDLDHENFLSILSSYSLAGGYDKSLELVEFVREHLPKSHQIVTEAAIVIHCKANQLKRALDEYYETWKFNIFRGSRSMYESLIKSCDENELFAEASQVFSDMRFNGVESSYDLCKTMVLMYCKMGFPETAHNLVNLAEEMEGPFDDVAIYVSLIEAYGKLKVLERGESLVGILRQRVKVVDRKVWNALIHAYAIHGYYEKARAAFNTMMRDGPSPSVDTVNALMQALIVDGRLEELYVVIQELQDMGFIISKSSILLMLDAFARVGNIFEVKKIYNGMKASGYYPSMHLYRVMIELLAKGKRVRDVEAMVSEMELAGFKPDIFILNCVLKLYTEIEDFKKTIRIYRQIKEAGLKPDEDTYNTLILMYCRDRRPEEGLHLMYEMKSLGLDPKLDTYKSLISAFCKLQIVEKAEELFEGLRSKGYKLDRSFYHIMMKIYRTCGDHLKAEKLLDMMKEAGVEPTIATMHMLMISYGSSGQPNEAEKVLNNLKTTSSDLALPYSSVINAYLKNGDYNTAIQKLDLMRGEGVEPDHRIWTCFVRAASLCQGQKEAIMLLNAIKEDGFDLPLRLLTEKSESLVSDVDQCLEKLKPLEDNAALNFVNAIEDLLWAFELRATASLVFQLAIKQSIYRNEVFRVADKDWGADFRKLSAGAALVGLTLWLDHMQDASLEGFPESPKSVVLITGASEYNNVSLDSTLKAYLWEMGSPFLPCKTRSGLLIAKAHSLRMWLKDSPFCLDLELRDGSKIPELNSMQLIEGCFIRRGLVPAFKDINEKLGQVRPKKFARLALLTDSKRSAVIQADIDGRAEKLAKLKTKGFPIRKKVKRFRTEKFIRTRRER